jgi:hypothetical protein
LATEVVEFLWSLRIISILLEMTYLPKGMPVATGSGAAPRMDSTSLARQLA